MKCIRCSPTDHWGKDCPKVFHYLPCTYCGSTRHLPDRCNIKQKIEMLQHGEATIDYLWPNRF